MGRRLHSICRWLLVFAMFSAAMFGSSRVDAQQFYATGWPALTTTTGIGATTIGGGVGLTIFLSNQDSNGGDSDEKSLFIRHNAAALQQGLTLGQGPAIRDLAATFRVDSEDRKVFARMLQRRSQRLVPLTRLDKLDRRRAEEFFRRVARGMRTHRRLRDDLRETSAAAGPVPERPSAGAE